MQPMTPKEVAKRLIEERAIINKKYKKELDKIHLYRRGY